MICLKFATGTGAVFVDFDVAPSNYGVVKNNYE